MEDDPSSPLSPVPSHLDEMEIDDVAKATSTRSTTPAKRLTTLDESTNGRSVRQRKAPQRLADQIEVKASPKGQLSTPKRKVQPVRGNWSTEHLLTNPSSKFASTNLMDVLSSERAWTALSREQQLKLMSMLPAGSAPSLSAEQSEDEPLPHILHACLKGNSSFSADVRLFQEDLKAGRYDPQWLRDAKTAMQKRANGDFDDWKEQNREEFWGQKQKIDWDALAGESSQHNLPTLVKAGLVQVGDVWMLRRARGLGKSAVVVEKEAKVEEISSDHELSFSFPPNQHKLSAPANGEDKTIHGVSAPITLSDAILAEDGRIAGVRSSNAWREFRCMRKNQDMGSPWDIRELHHRRLAGDDNS